MSNWREQFEEESGTRVLSVWLAQYYQYLVLLFFVGFAFWNRARNWGNFVVGGEVLFRSNDPWYHYRSTQYVVNNYPSTMPFDAWTGFAEGTAQSQFGTILDQILATIALIVGLGSPSDQLVRYVVLFGPALFGAAILLPTYVIGRRLGGRGSGIIAAGVVAFAPDGLLGRSVVGFSDHHVAEALFQACAVLGVMVALKVAQEEKPVWELIAGGNFDAVRRPLGWSIAAGIAIGVYLWAWPPGVLLIGILGAFFVLHLSFTAVRGESPEHTALVGAVSLTTAGLLQLSTVNTLGISATSRSLLQVGLPIAIAVACVFMAWFFRQWERQELPAIGYPAAIGGIILLAAVLMSLVLPSLFNYFVDQVLRVIGFQTSPTAGTVGEAQPLRNPAALFGWYRLAFFTAIGGVGVVLVRQYARDKPSPAELLAVVWFFFIIAATFTQARFSYYLAVPVAALTAITTGMLFQYLGPIDDVLEVEPYQVMLIMAVVLVTIAPMLVGGSGAASVLASADGSSNPGGIVGWNDGLQWLSENTPLEGQYANPDGEPMDMYGVFDKTDNYDYPNGSYGVISWWDYGHWITAQGERIPVANPFQQNSDPAAEFLTAQSEEEANSVLEGIEEDDAKVRYAMVDWKMIETETGVNGKFFAPIRFAENRTRSQFYSRVASIQNQRLSTQIIRHKQDYYNSTAARLYLYHGSAKEPRPIVTDWRGSERPLSGSGTFVQPPADEQPVKLFSNMTEAREFVEEDGTAQIGGVGAHPAERVPAMEHYRLVHMSELSGTQGRMANSINRDLRASGIVDEFRFGNATQQQAYTQAFSFLYPNSLSWVKTFERVPGATIEGTGPANRTITLSVRMSPRSGGQTAIPRTNRVLPNGNFTYTQRVTTDENGNFNATVPYSTTGYDAVGPEEGYTNTDVRARGPYRATVGRLTLGTFNVTEKQVVGATDEPATPELKTVSEAIQDQFNTTDPSEGDNTTVDDGTGDNTTDGSTDNTTDGSTNESSGSTNTSGSVEFPPVTDATRVTP